jgi:hypothetical protein
MKKLLLLLGLVFLVIASLLVRHEKDNPWRDYQFSRNSVSVPLKPINTSLPFAISFDRILLSNKKIIIYNTYSKTQHSAFVYNQKLGFEKRVDLPLSTSTLINGQNYQNSLYLIDFKKKMYKVRIDSLTLKYNDINIKNLDRATIINDSIILVKQQAPIDSSNQVFALYNTESGRRIQMFDVLPQMHDYGLNSDGIFIRDNQSIYFKCYLNSNVYHFDITGKYKGKFKEINRVDKKYQVIDRQGSVTFSEPIKSLSVTAAVDNNRLYVHSKISAKNDNESNDYIDVYSANGLYVASFSIAHPSDGSAIKGFTLQGNILYVLRQGRIEAYIVPPLANKIVASITHN